MGEIARVLLSYHADVEARGQSTGPDSEAGPTATELAAEDSALSQLFRAHLAGKGVSLTLKVPTKSSAPLEVIHGLLVCFKMQVEHGQCRQEKFPFVDPGPFLKQMTPHLF